MLNQSFPARQQADRGGAPHSGELENGMSKGFPFRGAAPATQTA
jgi:hypothetical protein